LQQLLFHEVYKFLLCVYCVKRNEYGV